MKKSILVFMSCILQVSCIAQISSDLIIRQFERMSEYSEEEYNDYSEILESYWNITDNPIDINSDDIDQLAELKFITPFQLENIKRYIKDYGDIQFIEELYMIETLDSTSVEIIKPLVCFNTGDDKKIRFRDILQHGKSKMFLEVNQCLNKKKGYIDIEDSLLYLKPNSVYLGSQQRIYYRYNYSFRDKIEAGFVLEKDPGEYILKNNINDSIRKLLGDKCYSGFDFFSFHLHLRNIAFVKSLVIGDYKLSFGQGLTMGSGMAFASNGGSLFRRSKKISASKSANEAYYLRGIAGTLKYRNIELSIFYSSKKSDANVISYDTLNNVPLEISSLQHNGLHRTYNEIEDRRTIRQQLYGINLSYRNSHFQVGYTLHKTDLSSELRPVPQPYNTFHFKGKNLVNQGLDFYYVLNKIILYGEIAVSSNRGTAGLTGITFQPTGYIEFNILYRNYTKDYHCLYSNAYATGSNTRNEEGWYFGINTSIASNWRFITSIDFYKSRWLKSNAYAPSENLDYDAQICYQSGDNISLSLELRNNKKKKNTTNTKIHQKYLIEDKNNMIRFHISYKIAKDISMRNRAEYHFNKHEDGRHKSYLIYQDIMYKPENKAYEFSFRYGLFNAEKGSVYTYENDILHAFAVNGLSQKGIRTYLVGKIKLMKQIQLSYKFGFTIYDGKEDIGSGLESIDGNIKGDCKLQVVWSF